MWDWTFGRRDIDTLPSSLRWDYVSFKCPASQSFQGPVEPPCRRHQNFPARNQSIDWKRTSQHRGEDFESPWTVCTFRGKFAVPPNQWKFATDEMENSTWRSSWVFYDTETLSFCGSMALLQSPSYSWQWWVRWFQIFSPKDILACTSNYSVHHNDTDQYLPFRGALGHVSRLCSWFLGPKRLQLLNESHIGWSHWTSKKGNQMSSLAQVILDTNSAGSRRKSLPHGKDWSYDFSVHSSRFWRCLGCSKPWCK